MPGIKATSLFLLCALATPAAAQEVSYPPVSLPWFSVTAYGAVCNGVTNDAAAIQAAMTAITASSNGGILYFPAKDCVLGSQITASIGAKQRLIVKSEGMHGARLDWSNAASAGFAITEAAVPTGTWLSDGPSVSFENVTNISTWSTTTSQTALSVTSTTGDNVTTFQRPSVPSVFVKNFNSISSTNSGGFATLLALTNIATVKIEDLSMWASTGDTTAGAVVLASTGAVYTGLRFDGIRQQRGGTAFTVTDSAGGTGGFQGIYITDMQTVGTQQSISWTNPNGYTGADNLQVTFSQLNSSVGEIVTSGVTDVQVKNDYLLTTSTGWVGLSITGGDSHTVTDNIFKKAGGADATGIGVHAINVSNSTFANNAMFAFSGGSSSVAPILLTGTCGTNTVTGNTSNSTFVLWDACSSNTTDRVENNVGKVGGVNFIATTLGAASSNVVNMFAAGNDATIQWIFNAAGLPSTDFNFRDGNAHTILDLMDSQTAVENATDIVGGASGVSPTVRPHGATNILFGVTGSPLATSVTSGLPAMPYMAGKPTGVPAATGGAPFVFDTTDNELCIWNPTGTPAWKCSAAFPN